MNTECTREQAKIMYTTNGANYNLIPGSPIAYWVSAPVFKTFSFRKISDFSEARIGLATGRNDYYLRLWHEVEYLRIGMGHNRTTAYKSSLKWFPYNKGGSFRKWYGNKEYVINWEKDGEELQQTLHPDGHRIWAHNFNLDYIFKEHISWSDINTGMMSFRAFEKGFLFDSSGTAAFVGEEQYFAVLAYLNTKYVNLISKILNPTIHFTPGDYSVLPYKRCDDEEIGRMSKENVQLCKEDWDAFETSWDFKAHPLI